MVSANYSKNHANFYASYARKKNIILGEGQWGPAHGRDTRDKQKNSSLADVHTTRELCLPCLTTANRTQLWLPCKTCRRTRYAADAGRLSPGTRSHRHAGGA